MAVALRPPPQFGRPLPWHFLPLVALLGPECVALAVERKPMSCAVDPLQVTAVWVDGACTVTDELADIEALADALAR